MVTLEVLWQEFLKILCVEVGSRVVETWFKAVSFIRWDVHEKVAYLRAPNAFVRDWVHTHYGVLIQQHLGRLLNESSVRIVFVDGAVQVAQPALVPDAVREERSGFPDEPVSVRVTGMSQPITPYGQYQFDSFVVGPHNSLAYAAAHAVTERPGLLYNPLVIYGESGVGKTHLLHAIGNQVRAIHKRIRVLYQSADRFVSEFVAALRTDRIKHMEAKYKELDVLLMDDIQLMSNKATTQEFFFHIFNTLQQTNKQLVFTSNIAPGKLAGLTDRMRTRLEGSLVTDIQAATLDARVAIVKKKATHHNIPLHDDIAYFIAARVDSNIRDLEGSLIKVIAFASLTKQQMSLDLAQRVLTQVQETKRRVVELPHIAAQVSKYFNYTITELRSSSRTKDLALARHVAVYLMKKLTDRSLREIAGFLERRDHSTIIYALDKIEQQRMQDAGFAALLEHLECTILR